MRALARTLPTVFRIGARLTRIERGIIDAVGSQLNSSARRVWEKQVQAIYKIQRLPGGVEVDFYMRDVKGHLPTVLPRFSHVDEFVIAKVTIDIPAARAHLKASVWCVSGRLFSIEYEGSVRYLDEVLGADPTSELHLSAQLTNEASALD